MTLFELVAGKLPFEDVLDAVVAGAVIAGDMDQAVADVRDLASEEVRAGISSSFADVLVKGLQKRAECRTQTADELAGNLHSCLVDGGEASYSTFISYRIFSEKCHAVLLHDVLNNTVTPGGHRVINYLDARRLVSGEDWEQGFSRGLLNSLVALPLVSAGVLDPMMKLTGGQDDRHDNVVNELQIMHALIDVRGRDSGRRLHPGKLEAIFPILIGKPSSGRTGNFFQDGSAQALGQLVEAVSPTTTKAVRAFLEKSAVPVSEGARTRTVASTVANTPTTTHLHCPNLDLAGV